MKKTFALLLALVICLSMFAACGGGEGKKKNEEVKDDGVMKILLIGHSTGMDSAYMLPAVAKNEGVENLVVGMLYHSGCRLGQHVEYLTGNAPQYAYYELDVATQESWYRADAAGNFLPCAPDAKNDIYIEDGSIGQTMQFGISRHDWDIVVMQAGCWEAANKQDGAYTPNFDADIKTIQDYVLANDINKDTAPKFAWNMIWGTPDDHTMLNEGYKFNLEKNFGGDSLAFYNAIAETTRDLIKPEENFSYFMPSATVLRNMQAQGMTPQQLYRDTIHGSDITRVAVSYLWYCTFFGADIESCNLNAIPSAFLMDSLMRNTNTNLEFTAEQKAIIVNAVKNAIANPYAITE